MKTQNGLIKGMAVETIPKLEDQEIFRRAYKQLTVLPPTELP